MKKALLLAFLYLFPHLTWGYGKLGVQLAMGPNFSSLHAPINCDPCTANGIGLGWQLGTTYDTLLYNPCYFSTGLFWAAQSFSAKSTAVQEKHALQYLQVPCLLKLYTSEIALDIRAYIKLGSLFGFRLRKSKSTLQCGESLLVQSFKRFSIDGLLGVGVEYQTSLSTSLFAGASYQWGIRNRLKELASRVSALEGYVNVLSLDVGVRF